MLPLTLFNTHSHTDETKSENNILVIKITFIYVFIFAANRRQMTKVKIVGLSATKVSVCSSTYSKKLLKTRQNQGV
jgi:hypothetical protein